MSTWHQRNHVSGVNESEKWVVESGSGTNQFTTRITFATEGQADTYMGKILKRHGKAYVCAKIPPRTFDNQSTKNKGNQS